MSALCSKNACLVNLYNKNSGVSLVPAWRLSHGRSRDLCWKQMRMGFSVSVGPL